MRRARLTRSTLTRPFLTRGLAALVLAATAVACDDAGPTVPTDPTDTAPTFTETFTGVLSRNGAVSFPFTVAAAGTATGTLTTILPDNTVPLGFAMGTWTGTNCVLVISNDNAIEFSQVVGSVGGAGILCLRVYDIGRINAATTFTVTVVHP
jgi:hypothetical protein